MTSHGEDFARCSDTEMREQGTSANSVSDVLQQPVFGWRNFFCRNLGQRASLEMREVFLELGAVAFQPASGRNVFCELNSQLKAKSCNFLHSSSESVKHPPFL